MRSKSAFPPDQVYGEPQGSLLPDWTPPQMAGFLFLGPRAFSSEGTPARAGKTRRNKRPAFRRRRLTRTDLGMTLARSANGLSRRRRAGSSRRGKPFSPTKAFFPCCGRCFRIIPICCRLFSRTIPMQQGWEPALCANRSIRAKAPMWRWSAKALRSSNRKGRTAPKDLFARPWRRCRTFRTNIRWLEAG
jgi:hypothetical protein